MLACAESAPTKTLGFVEYLTKKKSIVTTLNYIFRVFRYMKMMKKKLCNLTDAVVCCCLDKKPTYNVKNKKTREVKVEMTVDSAPDPTIFFTIGFYF